MANGGYINTVGRLLTLRLDPTSGIYSQLLTVSIAPLSALAMTASAGAVAPYTIGDAALSGHMNGIVEDRKYPFGDLVLNEVKVRIELNRQVKFSESFMLDAIAGFVTDDSEVETNAVTNLPITNYSLVADYVEDMVDDDTKLVFVSNSGNDTNAGAVDGVGYYTRLNAAVGPNPRIPAGSPIAYATLGAALAAIGSDDNAVVLFNRGETFDGATHYAASGQMLGLHGGIDETAPLIFTSYGSGAKPKLISAATLGNRTVNIAAQYEHILYRGLDLDRGATAQNCIRILAPSTTGSYGHYLFQECDIHDINPRGGTAGQVRYDVGFDRCRIVNGNDASGVEYDTNYIAFSQREYDFYRCAFEYLGADALEHGLYSKTCGDTTVQECIFRNISGNPVKGDAVWGYEFSRNLIVQCLSIMSLEANGDANAGTPSDRTRIVHTGEYPNAGTSEGAISRWISCRNNVLTDTQGAVLAFKMGMAYDSSVHDNVVVTNSTSTQVAFGFQNNSGGGTSPQSVRDAYGNECFNNSIAFVGNSAAQAVAINITLPDNDAYTPTGEDSHGQHDITIRNNAVYFAPTLTGDVRMIKINADTWDAAEDAGRMSGWLIEGNSGIFSSEATLYEENGTTYGSMAAIEARFNQNTTVAQNNSFADPGFSNPAFGVTEYANALGGFSLDQFMDALIDGLLNQSLAAGYSPLTVIDAINSTHFATLTGDGVTDWAASAAPSDPADISVTQSASGGTINLGNVALGSSPTQTLTINNDGDPEADALDLDLGVITVSTGSLSTDPSNTSVAAGASTTAVVTLDASAEGVTSTLVTIPSNDPDTPSYTITISATVVGAELSVSQGEDAVADGATIDLGGAEQGAALAANLTLENTGLTNLTIGTIMVSGALSIDMGNNPSGDTLAPGETATLVVEVDTGVLGAVSGTVSVPSNDSASPWGVTVQAALTASSDPSDDYTGPDTQQLMLSVAEADAIIAEMLIGQNIMRQFWTSLTSADKLSCIATTTIDFNAVRWDGSKLDPDQPNAWPRVDRYGDLILPQGEVQYPASLGGGSWSFPSLPREIRVGVAIQSAARAMAQAELDQTMNAVDMAAQGVSGINGAGVSWSVDALTAREPRSRLHPYVRRLVDRYLARTVGVI